MHVSVFHSLYCWLLNFIILWSALVSSVNRKFVFAENRKVYKFVDFSRVWVTSSWNNAWKSRKQFFLIDFDILNDQSKRQEQEEEKKFATLLQWSGRVRSQKLNLGIERAIKKYIKTKTHSHSSTRMQCCSALSIDDVIRQHRWIKPTLMYKVLLALALALIEYNSQKYVSLLRRKI